MPRKLTAIRHEFVEFIPEELAEQVLYISIPYNTMVHRCFCGCGSKVVTPLSPTDWKMVYDGKAISLHPSVGSWNLPCRSHYVIDANTLKWGEAWTQEEVAAERERDREAKASYYRRPRPEAQRGGSAESKHQGTGRPTLRKRIAKLFGRS